MNGNEAGISDNTLFYLEIESLTPKRKVFDRIGKVVEFVWWDPSNKWQVLFSVFEICNWHIVNVTKCCVCHKEFVCFFKIQWPFSLNKIYLFSQRMSN